MRSFAYARPETAGVLFALLEEYGPDAKLLTGGTDLVVRLRMGHALPRIVIDLKRVAELSADIVQTGSGLRVGALTVMSDIIDDARVQHHFPALVEAASVVGSVQIRHRATLAGNICNASPAADTAPVLLAYGAKVHLRSKDGTRVVPIDEFFTGPGKTVLRSGEIVESIELPFPPSGSGAAFGRVTRRRGVDLATINLACLVTPTGAVRFAYGAAGPRPFLVEDASGVLADPSGDPDEWNPVLERIVAHASPITDVRGSQDYRQAMLLVMSRRTLRTAITRMPGSGGTVPAAPQTSPDPRKRRGLSPASPPAVSRLSPGTAVQPATTAPITLTVNGTTRSLNVLPHHTLLRVLRDQLHLTGTKECCAEGECGACTILLDGRAVNSCLVLAVEADGADILTIEGLSSEGTLDPLQTAFLEKGAVQCGFCIPGMIMASKHLLERQSAPDRAGNPGGAVRKPVSLRRLQPHHRSRGRGRRGGTVMEDDQIGRSAKRVGGIERVTGAQRYAADIRLDNVLHVKLVHLPCARARINSIDTREAERVDGVRLILTAADLPQPVPRYGPNVDDRPVLAVGETKFFGEPVAAVAAETEDAAETAAALVRVDYEELPAVLTVDAARDPAAALVQDPELRPNDPYAHTNIRNEYRFGWGSVPEAEAKAPCIVENDYTFPMVTHFAIEPHVFMAAPDENGITVWSPIQHPYILQRVVASTLGWPVSKVRVVAPDPGGAFGGKGYPKLEPLTAFLALKTGRPVRLVLTLEETFQSVRRASAQIHARTGFDPAGRIVFQDVEADFLIGAYADVGIRVVSKSSYVACGPYRTQHARITARALLSHTTPSTAFRGYGTPQHSWALESQLDEAARLLNIDRVEIRRRNLAEKGEAFIPGDTPADGDWKQSLDQAAAAIGWGEPLAKNRGRGIAMGIKSSSTASLSYAMVRLHWDGSASVMTGTSDMGQGARTVFAQLTAQELGVALASVTIVMGDTSVVPFDSSTSASRSTVFMGNAIVKACQDIKGAAPATRRGAVRAPSRSDHRRARV